MQSVVYQNCQLHVKIVIANIFITTLVAEVKLHSIYSQCIKYSRVLWITTKQQPMPSIKKGPIKGGRENGKSDSFADKIR